MGINYDFDDLEAFMAVKETNSFRLAAEKLHLSQSVISRRIRKLETALDSILFERTTRSVKPTLAAKRLHVRAKAMLDDRREMTLAMRDESVAFQYQRNIVITVALVPTVVSLLIPTSVKAFHKLGQKARFRLLDLTANGVAEQVAKGEADFGISSIPELEPNTEFIPLFNDEIVMVCPENHKLAELSLVNWTDFAAEELIVPCRGTGNRLLIDETMARAGLSISWSYEIRRSTTALELVAAGMGLALLPKSAIDPNKINGVEIRTISNPCIIRPIGLLKRIGHKPTAAEEIFMSIICRVASEI